MLTLPGYNVTEPLHESSNSVVVRALRSSDGLPVVVKVLRVRHPKPRQIAKLRREFDIAGDVGESVAIAPIALEPYTNGFAFVMADIQGESLDRLAQKEPFELTRFLKIAAAIARKLAQVHRSRIIHKDIKPENIVMNPQTGEIRLIDFGISSRLSKETAAATSPGRLEGTLAYMSPEQTGRMNRSIDYRTDLYSLGATLYELLTGRRPFTSTEELELVHSHIAREPEPPRQMASGGPVPEAVQAIILKLMSKAAEDRYQSGLGLAHDLEFCRAQLDANGRIDPTFVPGQRDVSDRFEIPQKLYGREKERTQLIEAFDQASEGRALLLLIQGHSGVGKSALIHEIHKPIARKGGRFISGKFDQFKRNVPYHALIQAFAGLVRQLLGESEERVRGWRDRLIQALGPNAQVLIDVIPEIEMLMGEQAPVPELAPTESQHRFNLAFQAFIQAFGGPQHPLVLFLDDLQWADGATLILLRRLLGDPDAGHLLVIGAFRDNEVNEAHPLTGTIEDLRLAGVEIRSIALRPLGLRDTYRLVSATVRAPQAPEERVQAWLSGAAQRDGSRPIDEEAAHGVPGADLAELVFRRTDGNPYFVNELLRDFHHEELIRFDGDLARWTWDVATMHARSLGEDVVQLMAERLRRLSESDQALLKTAAALGNEFDLRLFALALDQPPLEATAALAPLLREGLLLPGDDSYKYVTSLTKPEDARGILFRFVHDRVQQAAYGLLEGEEQARVHLRIARSYIEHLPFAEQDERLMEIVNHLNLARDLLIDRAERLETARWNLRGGLRARQATAYESALRLFGIAYDLLPEDAYESEYELWLGVHRQLGETNYLLEDLPRAERFFREVLNKARDPLEKLPVFEIQIGVKTGQGKAGDAINLGLQALELLNMKLPRNPSRSRVQNQLQKLRWSLRDREPEQLLKLPALEDTHKRAAMRLMMQLCMPAHNLSSELFPLIVHQMIETTLESGNAPPSAFAWAAYGMLISGSMGDVEGGARYGRLALDLMERLEARELRGRIYYLYAATMLPWKEHISHSEEYLKKAYHSGLETGDLQYVSLAIVLMNAIPLWMGTRRLTSIERQIEKYNNAIHKTGQLLSIQLNQMGWQFIYNMQGATRARARLQGERFDEAKRRPEFEREGSAHGLFFLSCYKTILAALFGQYGEARDYATEGDRHVGAVLGQIQVAMHNFYHVLSLLGAHSQLEPPGKAVEETIVTLYSRFKKWAEHCAENFQHLLELIEAELARIKGDPGRAMDYYDRAVASATRNGFPLMVGLANECAARFYLEHNKERFAALYLRDAQQAYIESRATGKASDLELRHENLLRLADRSAARSALAENEETPHEEALTAGRESRTTTSNSGNLDMASIIKASQAISREIQLPALLERLLRIVMENAGAQRGALILESEGRWFIQARGAVRDERIEVLQNEALETSPNVALSIVNYVMRTGSHLVVNDATQEESYQNDEYVREQRPRSVLCAPVELQGKLIGIVYLENNSARGAFTPDRLEVLNMLSSQIAASIENARLYSNLEHALEEERRAKQAQTELLAASSRFVPTEFLGLIGKDSIVSVRLGDNIEKELTVLFSDIRSFTTLSEKMSPGQNFQFINSYLERMGPIVQRHQGFIDKYIGDAIMALFPTPDQGIAAAVSMQAELRVFNAERATRGEPEIQIGIGLHTGQVMAGTIGEKNRMEGTVISDTVNLASRMEGLTKMYGATLIVSEETFDGVADKTSYRIRVLDRVVVKGKRKPVRVIEILDGLPEAELNWKSAGYERLGEARRYYAAGAFGEARQLFESMQGEHPEDKTAELYLKRCEQLVARGAPKNWNGITALRSK